jgi:hypothetical protein
LGTFIALVAAIGVGTIISALVGHQTAISNHRQAWINALRDDLAEYFKALGKMNDLMPSYLTDSQKHEAAKSEIKATLFLRMKEYVSDSTELKNCILNSKRSSASSWTSQYPSGFRGPLS